jgi:hypothetical protein
LWRLTVVEPRDAIFDGCVLEIGTVSITSTASVTSIGVAAFAGARHVTEGPVPLNVPTVDAQLNVSRLQPTPASVTVTLRAIDSSRSAKPGG